MIGPFGRRRREQELDEEIRVHLDMAVRDRVSRGESRAAAERAVRREFGDVGRVKEVTRRMWGGMWFDRLAQDVGFGFRSFVRDPGFALAAILILVVGIGANAVVFTLTNEFLFEAPPAVAEPDRLVGLRWIGDDGSDHYWSYTDYQFVREHAAGFSGVLSYMAFPAAASIGGAEAPVQAATWAVSDNYFDVLGVEMALGRGFLPEEGETLGTHPVAVISHGLWERYYGRDPDISGRTLNVNGTPFTVVGVAPRGMRGISPVAIAPDVFVPLMMQGVLVSGSERWFERTEGHMNTWVQVVGRLRNGVTAGSAQANLDLVHAEWEDEFARWAESNELEPFRFVVSPDYRFSPGEGERIRRMLGFLTVIVATLLLVGSANLAILLLARASGRRRELGVRAALGAGRFRLLRQLLTESMLLSLLGGLGGLLLASATIGGVALLLPYSLAVEPQPDGTVLMYTVTVTLVVTLVFGLVPAFQLSRANLSSVLKRDRRSTGRSRARSALVIAQIAASMILLLGAGLFVRSLVEARATDLGFDPANKLFASAELANHGYDQSSGRAFIQQTLERLRARPEVQRATVVGRPPFSGRSLQRYDVPGTPFAEVGSYLYYNPVGPDYFAAMRIPIVSGRPITNQDVAGAPNAIVVNQTVAERLWRGEEAVGRTLRSDGVDYTVVGVAANATYHAIGEDPVSQVYPSFEQSYQSTVTFLVESAVPPNGVGPTVARVFRDLDPTIAISSSQTLAELVDAQAGEFRVLAILASIFGILALFMAAAGLYGVQSYLVGQRIREIGIRMALGAERGQVSATILRRGVVLVAVGVLIGTGVAFGAGDAVRSMLFGVAPNDPVTYAVALALLVTTSLVASYVPARRASRVDPIVALREE